MVIRAQIGNCAHVGILVLGFVIVVVAFFFLSDVVDPGLVLFAVCIDHLGSLTAARVAFTLHVAFFLAVTADNVGVMGPVAVGRGDGTILIWVVLKFQAGKFCCCLCKAAI